MKLLVGIALAAAACGGAPADDGPCTCTPGNVSRVRSSTGAAPLDDVTLLAELRQHVAMVRAHRNPRDIKVFDDELRNQILNFCVPCSGWVPDRSTIDELYPLDRLDHAVRATCLGLVLRDGTTVWGDRRPRNCR
ncbi:MAG: hypothetical protein KF773_38105 [Deltaproteobacteria bacterium]|nr:hypothetical protein [Deltaproteobacteria bacterium]MCW5808788.1 hypothetical protein [Deltaproteobacteria bacterium]